MNQEEDDPSRTPEPGAPGTSEERGQPASSSGKSSWVQVERYVQLGVTLPAATLIGWLAGAWLDKKLHTSWLYLAGLLLGIAAGFFQLIRAAMAAEKEK